MKPKTQRNLLYILIPSFILIIIWLAANIYDHAVKTTITGDEAISIQPISGTFDTRVLTSLRQRTIAPSDATAQVASPEAILSPTPTPIVDITPDPNATSAGGALP